MAPLMLVVREYKGCSTMSFTPTAAARCTTTSQLRTAWSTASSSRTEPCQKVNRALSRTAARLDRRPVDSESSTETSLPSASRASTRCDPMNPAPPVIRYRATGTRLHRPLARPIHPPHRDDDRRGAPRTGAQGARLCTAGAQRPLDDARYEIG